MRVVLGRGQQAFQQFLLVGGFHKTGQKGDGLPPRLLLCVLFDHLHHPVAGRDVLGGQKFLKGAMGEGVDLLGLGLQ